MSLAHTPLAAADSSFARQAVVQWLLGVVLVFAPLFRSGQPALAVLTLELLAASILVLVLWKPRDRLVNRWEGLAIGLLLATPLVYLIPVSPEFAAWLPGREPYLNALSLVGGDVADLSLRLSLYPLETESAFLLLLVPVALFLGVRTLDADRITQLVLLLLGIGTVQALLGLLQYGASEGSPAFLGLTIPDVARARGTYTNPDHLSGLLEMLLPIALALLFFSIGRGHGGDRHGWRSRVAFFGSRRGHSAVLHGTVALLILVGLIFARSRAGIALGMLGIFLSTLMFARRIGGDNVYGSTGTLIAFALGIGIAIGLVPVLDRFTVEESVNDARWPIFAATLKGIGVFSPLGSGPGTYPDVFPAFQPPEFGRWFINHAHNDYLEWLFEAGLLAAILITLLTVLYALRWLKVWGRAGWTRFRFIQVSAGIGTLMLLLHSLVDFNLHIPANIVYFSFLTGVFFSESEGQSERVRRRSRRTLVMETPDLRPASFEMPNPGIRRPVPPPSDQIKNPFLDD